VERGGRENKTTTHIRSFLAQRRNWPPTCTQGKELIGLGDDDGRGEDSGGGIFEFEQKLLLTSRNSNTREG